MFSRSQFNSHPSVKLEQVFKRDPLKLAEEDMKTPMLLLAAENDPAYVRENGAYVQQMKENKVDVAAHNFDDMQHGVSSIKIFFIFIFLKKSLFSSKIFLQNSGLIEEI